MGKWNRGTPTPGIFCLGFRLHATLQALVAKVQPMVKMAMGGDAAAAHLMAVDAGETDDELHDRNQPMQLERSDAIRTPSNSPDVK